VGRLEDEGDRTMKVRTLCMLFALGTSMVLLGCGGAVSVRGSLSLRLTDAKPLLEVDAIQALVNL
jgi:hypothetical protein